MGEYGEVPPHVSLGEGPVSPGPDPTLHGPLAGSEAPVLQQAIHVPCLLYICMSIFFILKYLIGKYDRLL